MANLYRCEWKSSRNDNEYRIDFYPPSSDAIVYTDIETIGFDAFRELTTIWDTPTKLPLGLATPVRCTAVIDATRIPSFLMQWLLRSKATLDVDLMDDTEVLATVQVRTGCIMEWSVKLPSDDWERIWVGIADVTTDAAIDPLTDTITATFVDAMQLAAKALPMTVLREADMRYLQLHQDLVTASRSAVIDWVWSGEIGVLVGDPPDTWQYIAHISAVDDDGEGVDHFWAVPIGIIYGRWERYLSSVCMAITRQLDTLPFGHMRDFELSMLQHFEGMRKQSYDANALPGDVLPNVDVHCIAVVASGHAGTVSETAEYDEWVRYTMHDALCRNERTLWDYLTELSPGRFKTLTTYWSRSSSESPWFLRWVTARPVNPGIIGTPVDITSTLRVSKIAMRQDSPGKVTASTEFAEGDDITTVTTQVPAGWNDGGLELAVLHDSAPLAWTRWRITGRNRQDRDAWDLILTNDFDAELFADYSVFDTADGAEQLPGIPPRMLGLYYIDDPTSATATPADAFQSPAIIRCHERQLFVGHGSPDTPPVTMPYSLPMFYGVIDARGLAQDVQEYYGAMRQLPTAVFAAFWRPQNTAIEGIMEVGVGQGYGLLGAPVMPQFHFMSRRWTINVVGTKPMYSVLDIPTAYDLVGCKTNWITELSECSFWGRE